NRSPEYTGVLSVTTTGRRSVGAHARAAALQQDHVAPAAVVPAEPLPDTDHPEPGPLVQAQAGGVLGEDPGLDGPDPGRLGGADQGAEQRGADPAPAGRRGDVHGVLDDTLVCAPVRHR